MKNRHVKLITVTVLSFKVQSKNVFSFLSVLPVCRIGESVRCRGGGKGRSLYRTAPGLWHTPWFHPSLCPSLFPPLSPLPHLSLRYTLPACPCVTWPFMVAALANIKILCRIRCLKKVLSILIASSLALIAFVWLIVVVYTLKLQNMQLKWIQNIPCPLLRFCEQYAFIYHACIMQQQLHIEWMVNGLSYLSSLKVCFLLHCPWHFIEWQGVSMLSLSCSKYLQSRSGYIWVNPVYGLL